MHGAEGDWLRPRLRQRLKHFTEVHGAEDRDRAGRGLFCHEALHRSAWSRRLADTYINFTEVRGAEGGRWCLMDIKFTKRFTGVHETEDTLWLQSVLPAAEALHRSA